MRHSSQKKQHGEQKWVLDRWGGGGGTEKIEIKETMIGMKEEIYISDWYSPPAITFLLSIARDHCLRQILKQNLKSIPKRVCVLFRKGGGNFTAMVLIN